LSSSADQPGSQYDGLSPAELEAQLGVPRAIIFDSVSSTLDVAHAEAPDSPSGTLILADAQLAGRGRQGKRWTSNPGVGIWMTLIERPRDPQSLDVLALRCGLRAAAALEALAPGRICLKWPNDLYCLDGKLAGILIETRWRGTTPEWVAIGFGLNVKSPDVPAAMGLRSDASRLDALSRLVPALRDAAAAVGPLSETELQQWSARDVAVGKRVSEPAVGTVEGITPGGEVRIREANGDVRAYRSGSLNLVDPITCS
jgi:BirA family biotin operon repressor/biotin-[acetyl-CoA-carboxylase] ligase